ncbi:hypothetical protein [Staphylococcus equorum]|uniref:hypothetical protein n=1 Tax=Staphylococcus equorum TaxID=246432 RepID=UPI00398A52AF
MIYFRLGARFVRGSDELFDGFKLKEDPEVKKAMPKEKCMKVQKEKFNDYSGDYLMLPTKDGEKQNNYFVKLNIWKIIKQLRMIMLFIIQVMKRDIEI